MSLLVYSVSSYYARLRPVRLTRKQPDRELPTGSMTASGCSVPRTRLQSMIFPPRVCCKRNTVLDSHLFTFPVLLSVLIVRNYEAPKIDDIFDSTHPGASKLDALPPHQHHRSSFHEQSHHMSSPQTRPSHNHPRRLSPYSELDPHPA